MIILGIDPGPVSSACVLLGDSRMILGHEQLDNFYMLEHISHCALLFTEDGLHVACEMVQHYGSGMSVGKEVFDTVFWVGRFYEAAVHDNKASASLAYRPEIKQFLCRSVRATDSNVRQALIDLLGHQWITTEEQKIKRDGTFKIVRHRSPGPTHGIHDHEWAALAVAVFEYSRLSKNKETS